MEAVLVASDDLDPSIRTLLDAATDDVSDDRLVQTIGNVTSRRIGLQLQEGGFDVEYRDLDALIDRIEERCRIGSDFSAIVLSTIRPYRGMNDRLKDIGRRIRNLDDRICLPSGIRVKNIPIVIALSLEMAGRIGAPPDGRLDIAIAWCTVRRPGQSFSRALSQVIGEWRRDIYLQLDYVGYALGFNARGELDISPVLRRTRRASDLFSESASPHSLGEGGMILVPEVVEEQMDALLELREICGNLANIAAKEDRQPEAVVHSFLDRHPEILYRGEFDRHWSERLLAKGTRPDFVLAAPGGVSGAAPWEVLELKRPEEVVVRKREFSVAVVRGFVQLRRYQEALATGESRAIQEQILGQQLVAPRMCLLIGRSVDETRAADVRATHLASEFNDISLITYDELAYPIWRRVRGLKERLLDQTVGL